jgi:hypothetical protein
MRGKCFQKPSLELQFLQKDLKSEGKTALDIGRSAGETDASKSKKGGQRTLDRKVRASILISEA